MTDDAAATRHKHALSSAGLHCADCGYSLRGLTEPRCPECGKRFDPDALHDVRNTSILGVAAGCLMFEVIVGAVGGAVGGLIVGGAAAATAGTSVAEGIELPATLALASFVITLWPGWRCLGSALTEAAQICRVRGHARPTAFALFLAPASLVGGTISFVSGFVATVLLFAR